MSAPAPRFQPRAEPVRHSALPWKATCFLVTAADKAWVCHTGMGNLPPSRSPESEANAAFIVEAVNSHASLKEALEVAARQVVRDGERIRALEGALRKIALPHSCGCLPCTGQCTSREAMLVILEEIQDAARAALEAKPAGGAER